MLAVPIHLRNGKEKLVNLIRPKPKATIATLEQ